MVIACPPGMSHTTTAMILKNKHKETSAGKGSASLKATRLTNIWEGPGSDMEELLMTWVEDQTQHLLTDAIPLSDDNQSRKFVWDVERKVLTQQE